MADTDQHQPAAAAPGLSEAEIGEIQARVDAAAPGPWQAKSTHGGPYRDDLGRAQAGFWIPELESLGDGECSAMLEDDAQFAAHARLDIPRLLADLARTRAEAAALRAKLSALAEWTCDEGGWRLFYYSTPPPEGIFNLTDRFNPDVDPALAALQSERPAAPAAPSAEAEGPETVRCHLCDVEIAAICDDCLKLVHDRMRELLDAMSPDHQAGDEHV